MGVHAADLELVAGVLVIAAGAWCGPVGRMIDLEIPDRARARADVGHRPVSPTVFQTIGSAESPLAWHRDRGGARYPTIDRRDG